MRVELPEHALDRADRLELLVAAPGPRQRPHGEAQRVFVGAAAAGDHGERPLGPRAFLLGRRSREARVGVRRLLLRRRLRAPSGLEPRERLGPPAVQDAAAVHDAPLAPHHGPLEPLLGVARHRPLEALPRQLLDLPGGHHVVSLTVALYGIYVSAQAT